MNLKYRKYLVKIKYLLEKYRKTTWNKDEFLASYSDDDFKDYEARKKDILKSAKFLHIFN